MTRRTNKPRRRKPTGGGVLVNDPSMPGVTRFLTDLRPQDKPTVVYAQLAERMRDEGLKFTFGYGILKELEAELGSIEKVWLWVLALAERLNQPLFCNVPEGPNSSITLTVPPRGWSAERVKGYMAGRHEDLENAFGPISHLVEP